MDLLNEKSIPPDAQLVARVLQGDAVNASPEVEAFVRAALREVNRLEELVEGE